MVYDDRVIEYSAVRKLLWHLLPLLCLLAMAHTLDRLNVSYAAPAMTQALRPSGSQIRAADDWFDLGYLLASLPAAWLMLRAGVRRWIVGIVLTWASIAIAHAMVWDTGSLYALRFLLGVAEASLLPAIVFYLCDWFPGRHRTRAIAALIAAASLVPLVGDEISTILLLMGRYFGITEWRWLFLMEGAPALWLGLTVLTELPGAPGDTTWLFPAERHWLQAQLAPASGAVASFRDGLRHPAAWKLAMAAMTIAVVAGNRAVWVPLAMQPSLYMPPEAGAVAMTAAAVLGAFGAAVNAIWWRNLRQWRRGLAGCLVTSCVCLGVAALVPGGYIAVLMLALVAILAPTILTLAWALVPAMLSGPAAAAGLAVVGMGGALGSALAGWLAESDGAVLRCLAMAALCLLTAWLVYGLDARPAPSPAGPAAPDAGTRHPSGTLPGRHPSGT